MKGKKRILLIIAIFIRIIIELAAYCVAIYFLLQKYYFFNEHNIHAQRAAWKSLNAAYQQEFKLLSTEFETKEVKDRGLYIHMWTYTFQDSQGRQFNSFVWLYGVTEKGDGMFYDLDYRSYVDDSYAQLCIEERLGDKFDLYKYRQEKASRLPNTEDYIFICTKDNAEEIAEILTEIYFEEMEFSNYSRLLCLVNNEEGEELFSCSGWYITRKLQEQDKEITKETVYTYILQELQADKTIISVAGWDMEYTPSDRGLAVEDFENIELGSSLDEIEKKLGEPDGWVGGGILSPVYILEDNSAVELVFGNDAADEDLAAIYLYKEQQEFILKKR